MKRAIAVVAFALILVLLPSTSTAKQTQASPYVQGTVLRVDKDDTSPNPAGQNPSDAPLADPQTYAYDVAVRVNCGTYVGRYESWYDYLPSLFAPSHTIQLRLTRSLMYVNVPNQKDVKLSIVHKQVERGPCTETARTTTASR